MADDNQLSLKDLNCDVTTSDVAYDFADTSRFRKIKFPEQAGITANSLLRLVPAELAADAASNTYILRFPEGIHGTLMNLHQGGQATTMVDSTGRIAGTASLYKVTPAAAAAFQVFSITSFATGQYFLADISSKLTEVNRKLDDLLVFLQTSKRTELLSELTFVKYALANYSTIMLSEPQRMATISNLQRAKIKAVADMEFYLKELEKNANTKNANAKNAENQIRTLLQNKQGVDLASQLYALSTIMESYYAQNLDETYTKYLRDETESLMGLMEKRVSTAIGTFANSIRDVHKEHPVTKKVKPYTEDEKELLHSSEVLTNRVRHPLIDTVQEALYKPSESTELYLTPDGNVYQKL